MNLRTALLAGTLALVCTGLRAEELQFTLTGLNFASGNAVPFSLPLELNTVTGALSSNTAPVVFDPDVVPIETFTATLNGRPVYSAADLTVAYDPFTATGTVLDTPGPSPTGVQNFGWEFGLYPGPYTVTTALVPTTTTWAASPAYSEVMWAADLNPSAVVWGFRSFPVSVSASVPEPGVISLLLSGMAGLWLARRKRAT